MKKAYHESGPTLFDAIQTVLVHCFDLLKYCLTNVKSVISHRKNKYNHFLEINKLANM